MKKDPTTLEEAVLERLCASCIDARDDGSCGLDPDLDCAVKKHLPEILKATEGVKSKDANVYVQRIRSSICAICDQGEPEDCDVRDQVDCPLDRYLVLVVEAIEELRAEWDDDALASAP